MLTNSDSVPSKRTIVWTIVYNGSHQWLQSQVLMANNTLNSSICHCEHGCGKWSAVALATSVYAKQPCNNLQRSIAQCFLPQRCIGLEAGLVKAQQVRFISHVRLTPGWMLIWVSFDPIQKIGPKVGDMCSFKGWRSFVRLWYMPVFSAVVNHG